MQKPPTVPKQPNGQQPNQPMNNFNIDSLRNDISSLVSAQMENFKKEFVQQQQQVMQQQMEEQRKQSIQQSENTTVQQQMKDNQLHEKDKVIQQLQATIESLKRQHHQDLDSYKSNYNLQMNEIQDRSDRQIGEYKRTIQQHEKKTQSLNETIDYLQQQQRQYKETIQQLRQTINSKNSSQDNTVTDLKQQLEQSQKENDHLQQELQRAHKEHEQLSAKYKDLDVIRKQELATLQYQISSLEERMRHMMSHEQQQQQQKSNVSSQQDTMKTPQDSSPLVKFHEEKEDRPHHSMHELNYDNHPINQPQFHSVNEPSSNTPLRSTMRSSSTSSNPPQEPHFSSSRQQDYNPVGSSFQQANTPSTQPSSPPRSPSTKTRSPHRSPSAQTRPPAHPGRSMKTMNDLVMAHQFPERNPPTSSFSDHPGGKPLTTAQYLSKQSQQQRVPTNVIQSPTKPKRSKKKVHKIRSTKKYEDILRSNSRRRSSRKRSTKSIKVPKNSAETVACESKLDILEKQISSWEERESNAISQVKRSLSGVHQFLDGEAQHSESSMLVDSIKNQLSTVLTLAESLLLSNADRQSICKHIIDLVNRDSVPIESCMADVNRYLGDCIREFSTQQVHQGSILTTIREHESVRHKKDVKHLKKSASHCLSLLDKAEKKTGNAVTYYGIPYRLIIERDSLQRELEILRSQDEQLKSWAARKRL